jgi:hypothetical protein
MQSQSHHSYMTGTEKYLHLESHNKKIYLCMYTGVIQRHLLVCKWDNDLLQSSVFTDVYIYQIMG